MEIKAAEKEEATILAQTGSITFEHAIFQSRYLLDLSKIIQDYKYKVDQIVNAVSLFVTIASTHVQKLKSLKNSPFRFTNEAINNQQVQDLVSNTFHDQTITRNIEESGIDGDLLDQSIMEDDDGNRLLEALGINTEECKSKWREIFKKLRTIKEDTYIATLVANSSPVFFQQH